MMLLRFNVWIGIILQHTGKKLKAPAEDAGYAD